MNIISLKTSPELLMPAGSFEKLKYAYMYGADAAYVGVPIFSLRARENEFSYEDLHKARELANQHNKKLYVTVNIFSKNRKLNLFRNNLSELESVKPDAFIMSDPGLMMIAKEMFPDINIHLSVQANCMNWESVRFWKKSLGISRVILSRELHIDEIREIKQRIPDIELEAFVHGSICIAYSGRCLMSSYMSHRDANQGVCDNSCREKYKVYEVDSERSKDYYLEDLRDSGKFYQISEDENGSYLMNAKDLRLIEYLREIYEAGVCSFKIEGRTKSLNYVSLVAKTYRQAIDDMMMGLPFNKKLLLDLDKVANRGYDAGFMIRKNPGKDSQNYNTSLPRNYTQKFAGVIVDSEDAPEGYVAVDVRNKITAQSDCELILPQGEPKKIQILSILDKKLRHKDSAHSGEGVVFLKTSEVINDSLGILSVKEAAYESRP